MRIKFLSISAILLITVSAVFAQQVRTFTVLTEPNAVVWVDDIKRGTTDETGKLLIKPVRIGNRKMRVRADGFKETAIVIRAVQKGEIKVPLVKTTDEAELSYQKAEKMMEEDKEKAAELYKKAITLRPKYPEAYLGLSRALSETGKFKEAHNAVSNARKIRPIYPELTAVEGRIYRSEDDEENTIKSFERAIKEGGGFQAEAYTGLAILYKEKAEFAGSGGDFEEEDLQYNEAAKYFKKAIEQLSATEPIVYYYLGQIYEKQKKYKEAIGVYEQFIKDMPDSEEVSVMQSFIVQIKKQMNGEGINRN